MMQNYPLYLTLRKASSCLMVALAFVCSTVYANNVTLSNVSLAGDVITFDVTWDNSWRNTGIPGSTENYDGVWVFAKYRACDQRTALNPGAFNHAFLSTVGANHVVPAGTTIELGTQTIGASTRCLGVFLHRTADQSPAATFTATGVKLKWDQAAQSPSAVGGNWDIKLFAIEMVYVPTGSFNLGDGASASRFYSSAGVGFPYEVTSPAAIPLQSGTGLYSTSSFVTGATLPATFPNGYTGFWAMKYEITQSQYVEFLNTLDRSQQRFRVETNIAAPTTSVTDRYVMSGTAAATYRNGIRCDATIPSNAPVTFYNDLNGNGIANETDDGQNIACNYLSRGDMYAYLDWSALRPLTELQYEKLCRGLTSALQSPSETVWGTDGSAAGSYTPITSVSNPGRPSEAGSPTGNGQIVFGNAPGVQGPVRVGQTFRGATTRVQAGASYYGAADLAGNVEEFVISIYNQVGQGYLGTYGDGSLNASGSSDLIAGYNAVPNAAAPWPWSQCHGGCSTCRDMSWSTMYRGGSWKHTSFTGNALVSARYLLEYYNTGACNASNNLTDTRSETRGGRGCR